MGHQPYGNHVYLKGVWTYITFLRNPIERTLSHYYFLTKDETYRNLNKIYGSTHVMWNNIPYYYLVDNFQTRFLANNIFGVQYRSMSSMLSTAIQNLSHMHVGVVEKFNESLDYFSKKFSLNSFNYENKKISNRPKSEMVDKNTLSLVQQHNSYDHLLYEYAKIIFAEQNAGI